MGLEHNMNIFYFVGYVKKALNVSECVALLVEGRGGVIGMSMSIE
jgi:hypothetical protein